MAGLTPEQEAEIRRAARAAAEEAAADEAETARKAAQIERDLNKK